MGWPPRDVRVAGIDKAHVVWLLNLRGERTLAQAVEDGRAAGLRPSTMSRLARSAAHCGLLDDASTVAPIPTDPPPPVREQMAVGIASARHLYGSGAHAVIHRRQRAEVVVQGSDLIADVVAHVLTAASVGSIVRGRAPHSGARRHRQAAARIACQVLCDATHPDAASDPDAMALDIPHLAVSCAGPRATIGPMVIPGRTSCLRCRDLHLSDADATWPRAAVQWAARRPADTIAGLAHLAGSWAALQVLALIDAGPHEASLPTLDGALTISLPEARPVHEPRPAHPLCGCRWPRTGTGAIA